MFGPLSVQCGRRKLGPSSFGGVKPKALLEILLLARGHLVHKDVLAEWLWPGNRPKNVTGTLESYVSVLRQRLFEDRAHARRVMVTAPGAYRFDFDEVSLDVDRFDGLLLRAERAAPGERRALWTEAVGLAGGDLLEDEPYALWVQAERELYRGRVARTHLLIAEDALADGDPAASLRHGEAALVVNPFSEKAFRAVMLAHHALGHSETSRAVFTACREVLDRELGVDPSAETVELAEAISAGSPAHPLLVPSRGASPGPESDRPRDRRDTARRMPFVGRVPELNRLRASIEASRAGRFALVVVEGRPGFGRTRLLEQLHRSLQGAVGRAAYVALDLEYPALPFAAALRDALRSSPAAADAARYSSAPWLSGVGDALGSLCELARRHGPLVLLLDDVHLADPGTIDALEWLQRQAPRVPLAIIATLKTPVPAGGPLLDRLGAVDRVNLGPLGPVDFSAPDDIGRELLRTSGGNPRLMADIWRWERAGGVGPPPSLEEAVKRRVRGLGGGLPALLQAAAGRPEPFGLLDLVVAADAAEPSAAELARLCDLDILETTTGGFRFVEPVVRDVLVATVSRGRRTEPPVDDPTTSVAA